MRDRPDSDDGGGRAALIFGFGGDPAADSDASQLPGLVRAFARAVRNEDWDRAARALKEAIHTCVDEDEYGEKKPDKGDGNPFGGRDKGSDDDDDLTF